jgi:hypothetical protein
MLYGSVVVYLDFVVWALMSSEEFGHICLGMDVCGIAIHILLTSLNLGACLMSVFFYCRPWTNVQNDVWGRQGATSSTLTYSKSICWKLSRLGHAEAP